MREDIKSIIDNYGVEKQLKHFQGEVFELSEAIIKHESKNIIDTLSTDLFKKTPKSIENITEEIADIIVMLEQFRLHYDIPLNEIRDVFEKKVERQLERIQEENRWKIL